METHGRIRGAALLEDGRLCMINAPVESKEEGERAAWPKVERFTLPLFKHATRPDRAYGSFTLKREHTAQASAFVVEVRFTVEQPACGPEPLKL